MDDVNHDHTSRLRDSGSPQGVHDGAPSMRVPEASTHDPRIGRSVRYLRLSHGLSLAQLAARSGLSRGFLSQVEHDKTSPSLRSLAAIANAIGAPLSWLFLDTPVSPRVIRAGDQRRHSMQAGVSMREVDGGLPADLRITLATATPGQATGLHAHNGDEHHLVLSGRFAYRYGDRQVELGPGDYMLWDAAVPHDAQCVGSEPGAVVIVTHRVHGGDVFRSER